MKDISKSINKVDNVEKSNGEAIYVNDILDDNFLYAKTVRSTIAKGKIISINKPVLPEGYFYVDHTDIPGSNFIKIIFEDWPVFAIDEVNHLGEPIFLVVGPDKETVQEIISNIKIEYIEDTPVFEYENSVINYAFTKGNPKDAFKNAKKIIKEKYDTGYQEQLYIEPQGMVGYVDGDKVILEGSIQSIAWEEKIRYPVKSINLRFNNPFTESLGEIRIIFQNNSIGERLDGTLLDG